MTDEHIIAAMELYGVGPHDFMRAQTTADTLAEFQQRVKSSYRRLVVEHHPDKGGNTTLFQAITAVNEDIQAMVVRRTTARRRFKWAMHIQTTETA